MVNQVCRPRKKNVVSPLALELFVVNDMAMLFVLHIVVSNLLI